MPARRPSSSWSSRSRPIPDAASRVDRRRPAAPIAAEVLDVGMSIAQSWRCALPTSAEHVLVDTSAALALVQRENPFHLAAKARLLPCRRGMSGHAAVELLSVLTRLPSPHRLSPALTAEPEPLPPGLLAGSRLPSRSGYPDCRVRRQPGRGARVHQPQRQRGGCRCESAIAGSSAISRRQASATRADRNTLLLKIIEF